VRYYYYCSFFIIARATDFMIGGPVLGKNDFVLLFLTFDV